MERGYRETPPPAPVRGSVECAWWARGAPGARVLPDGCMDLLLSPDGVTVAGPDTTAFVVGRAPEWTAGVRFRPGALPRLLGVPAALLRDRRERLTDVAPEVATGLDRSLGGSSAAVDARSAPALLLQAVAELAGARAEASETAPWSLPTLAHVTRRLRAGAPAELVADDLGCSPRTLTRHCTAVYGYGPSVLRRILRFRAAGELLASGIAPAEVAARTGYADQPHLARETRALAGVPTSHLTRRPPAPDDHHLG